MNNIFYDPEDLKLKRLNFYLKISATFFTNKKYPRCKNIQETINERFFYASLYLSGYHVKHMINACDISYK